MARGNIPFNTFAAHSILNTDTMRDASGAINPLIEHLQAAEQVYRTASRTVQSQELRTQLAQYADNRAAYATELANAVISGDAVPTHARVEPEAEASQQHSFAELQAAVQGDFRVDGRAMIECERAEDALVQAYDGVMEKTIPPATLEMLRRQYDGLLRTLTHLRELRDAQRQAD